MYLSNNFFKTNIAHYFCLEYLLERFVTLVKEFKTLNLVFPLIFSMKYLSFLYCIRFE